MSMKQLSKLVDPGKRLLGILVRQDCISLAVSQPQTNVAAPLGGLMLRDGRLPNRALQRMLADYHGHLAGYVIACETASGSSNGGGLVPSPALCLAQLGAGMAAGQRLQLHAAFQIYKEPCYAKCPFASLGLRERRSLQSFESFDPQVVINERRALLSFDVAAVETLAAANWKSVKADIRKLLTTQQAFWPTVEGHYGPLFIRLAWHSAGTYRTWDGRGGVNGARQRFAPENAWDDNTNLDKARRLLEPIKKKYGNALSWGDLIVLAGSTAIEEMGGPNIGFCGGRIDDIDGTKSLPLGPTKEQEAIAPCKLGVLALDMISVPLLPILQVNPEGPMGVPEPEKSVPQIRGTFDRMAMNDSETVALIGGGHAFGKTHGACPKGAGPGPKEDPKNPWPGLCGTGPMKGLGPNTFTSGFEGAWTTTPTSWSNQYFRNLLKFDWVKEKGPGGHFQWKPQFKKTATAEEKAQGLPDIMMLTTDIALLKDPEYLKWVKIYAESLDTLTTAFGQAWYKLMSRDMGPQVRCVGKLVPAMHTQLVAMDLGSPLKNSLSLDVGSVRADIAEALSTASSAATPDMVGGKAYYGALVSELAWRCAATFRATDKQGGCNGARIRLSPQKDWPVNKGLDRVILLLQPIKDQHPNLSWADLIVLAGTVANEQAAGATSGTFKFCPGRSDSPFSQVSVAKDEVLVPRAYPTEETAVKDNWAVQGLTPAEGVALAARLRSPARQKLLNFSGSWTSSPGKLSNDYFKVLLNNDWVQLQSAAGKLEYKAKGKEGIFMMPSDLVIKNDPALAAIAKSYAADNAKFLKTFAVAWRRAMEADRFKGPAGNLCEAPGAAV
eukprot:gene3692-3952_t